MHALGIIYWQPVVHVYSQDRFIGVALGLYSTHEGGFKRDLCYNYRAWASGWGKLMWLKPLSTIFWGYALSQFSWTAWLVLLRAGDCALTLLCMIWIGRGSHSSAKLRSHKWLTVKDLEKRKDVQCVHTVKALSENSQYKSRSLTTDPEVHEAHQVQSGWAGLMCSYTDWVMTIYGYQVSIHVVTDSNQSDSTTVWQIGISWSIITHSGYYYMIINITSYKTVPQEQVAS